MVRGVRRERVYWVVAFAALSAGASACAALAGLGPYSEFDGDGGGSHSGTTSSGDGTQSGASSGDITDDTADVTNPDDASDVVSPPEEAGDDAADRDASDGGGTTDAPSVVEGGEDAGEDASDGADAADATSVDASDGGCAHPVLHANGVGGGYLSCAPGSSYGLDEAQRACTSSGHGACATQMIICGLNDTETFECAAGNGGACVCWSYQQPNAGHVRISTLSPGLCQCAVATDPGWGY
jgi:hypothetical protein